MSNPDGYYNTTLETDIIYIKGVGPARGKILKKNRSGDHMWYISDNTKLKNRHKNWKIKRNLNSIVSEIINS